MAPKSRDLIAPGASFVGDDGKSCMILYTVTDPHGFYEMVESMDIAEFTVDKIDEVVEGLNNTKKFLKAMQKES